MSKLPIDEVLPALLAALVERDEAVLEAPPGAGKTTRVPLALLDAPWLAGQSILMLEPRRLAARAAAERLADELGEAVGERVGYRVRLDSRVGPQTRIEVVTEGILTRRLQADPALEGVGLVIFDEFHERSLEADLALALTRQSRSLLRETPLKVLLMSATLDGPRLSAWLDNAPLVTSSGRQYPVEIHWGTPWERGARIDSRVVQCVLRALDEQSGSVLVFLPGQAEIRRLTDILKHSLMDYPDVLLCPLFGDLALSQQRQAIAPAPARQRKVVLATNIAETSLTIEGVRVVVDAGLARTPRFDPKSGMIRLVTQRISQASATQRAGRAGRLEPGCCYRLWSESQHAQLAIREAPEILQADLASLALQLARWGATPDDLCWLDTPPAAAYAQAQDLLVNLGALVPCSGGTPQLTDHGQRLASLPVHPRLGHMLLRGQALGLGELAADLAALLVERDDGAERHVDLGLRLDALAGGGPRSAWGRVRQLSQQFRQLLPRDKGSVAAVDKQDGPGILLALAYPDRVARQREPGGGLYQLANGHMALLPETDPLRREPWLVVAELGHFAGQRSGRIYRAAALNAQAFLGVLAEQVRIHEILVWDEREALLRAERQRCLGALVLAREPLMVVDEQRRGEVLVAVVRRKGLALLPWTPRLRQWQARVLLLRQLDVENHQKSVWPDVSDQALLAGLEVWLQPYLGRVTRQAHFAQLDLGSLLQGLLPWPLPRELDLQAPEMLQVPSGSRLRLNYLESPPVLSVRLQELFGLADTPRIAAGRQKIKLHLLSPARRPVQVTQDLASFWRSTYAEVKKDLKGRYPKHYWPDDPLQAEPTARTRARR